MLSLTSLKLYFLLINIIMFYDKMTLKMIIYRNKFLYFSLTKKLGYTKYK
ncbi:MAG: hypothetical protein BAJALOKI1v1_130018 [Promethearchaeota archaeon]|nr:MAG: hypothetical protein BAJALOKI1v1_130018 [Candidatus Lokiarchaeota archaeon]